MEVLLKEEELLEILTVFWQLSDAGFLMQSRKVSKLGGGESWVNMMVLCFLEIEKYEV